MIFFKPTEQFLQWLVKLAGPNRVVFDVGCGEGDLVWQLQQRGVKALGIEPRWAEQDITDERRYELASSVFQISAEKLYGAFSRAPGPIIVLFCRPCHNGFVERVLRILPTSAEVFYITLPTNLGIDFPLAYWKAERIPMKLKEERLYRVTLEEIP